MKKSSNPDSKPVRRSARNNKKCKVEDEEEKKNENKEEIKIATKSTQSWAGEYTLGHILLFAHLDELGLDPRGFIHGGFGYIGQDSRSGFGIGVPAGNNSGSNRPGGSSPNVPMDPKLVEKKAEMVKYDTRDLGKEREMEYARYCSSGHGFNQSKEEADSIIRTWTTRDARRKAAMDRRKGNISSTSS